MSTLDWVLLAIVTASAVFGLMRGFIGAVVSLVSWALSGWVAFRFGGQFAGWIAGGAPVTPGQLLAGYALSFLGVLLLVGLIGWIVRWLMKSAGLSGVDRALGLALGVVRGGLVACMLVLLLGLTSMPREAEWRGSSVVPLFVPGAQALSAWLPGWVAAQVDLSGSGTAAEPSDTDAKLPEPLSA